MFPIIYRAPETTGDVAGGDAAQGFVLAEGDTVQLPAGFNPIEATFTRAGPDLMLIGEDGSELVIADYFMQENPPALMAEGGVRINGALAARLAGPIEPGAVAGEVAPSEAIGQVNALTGEVSVVRADGTRVTLQVGDPMFLGDIIETGSEAGVGVLLADGTSLSMGDDALLVLDEMVYDPGTQEGNMSVSVLKGVFTFVSGEISKTDPEAMLIHTPTATIGIRGTQVGIDLTDPENLSVVLMEESDGFVGEIFVMNDGGVMTINEAYYAVQVSGYGAAPVAAPTYSRDMLLQTFGVTFAFLPTEGTTANDYGLQAALSEGLAGFEGAEVPETATEGLADFETAAGGEEAAIITAAGGEAPMEGVVFGEEQAAMETVEGIAATAVGETEVSAPPPPPTGQPATEAPAPEAVPAAEPVVPPVDVTPPVVEPGEVIVAEDNAFTGQLVAADLEGGVVFDIAEGGLPANGTVSINADGSFEYIPDPDFSGSDTFTYLVTDDAGNTATATVTVTVSSVADTPLVAVTDVSGAEDAAVSLVISAAMPAGTTETVDSVTVSGVPEGATLSAGTDNGDGTWTLTPDQLGGLTLTPPTDYSGSIALSVTATSTDGSTSVAQGMTATIAPVADLPIVALTNVTGAEDTGITLAIAAAMPAGTTETIESVTVVGVPSGAILSAGTDNGDGTWTLTADQLTGLTLTPPADYSGAIDLSVTATSTDGGTTTQDMTATVLPVADQPVLTVSDVVIDLGGGGGPGEIIFGTQHADEITGTSGSDIIAGLGGHDVIYGDVGAGGGELPPTGEAIEVALDINAALTDVDGSEALSVEIAGVPDGASLSLGEYIDGTWTLTGEDLSSLDSLTMTLPEGTEPEPFELSVTATSTEADTGEFATASGVIDVSFEAGGGAGDLIFGGGGRDEIYGGGGGDVIFGGEGSDIIEGGAGDDIISGGEGADIITGGAGDDVLIGGQGADEFVFRAGDGNDIILDLGHQDELRFEGPEFSAEDFSITSNGDDTATITFGDDAGVSVTLNDYEPGEGYSVTQDGEAVVVTFHEEHGHGGGD